MGIWGHGGCVGIYTSVRGAGIVLCTTTKIMFDTAIISVLFWSSLFLTIENDFEPWKYDLRRTAVCVSDPDRTGSLFINLLQHRDKTCYMYTFPASFICNP